MPSRTSRIRRWALRLGSLALLLVGLARPQLGDRPRSTAHRGRDLLVLLDLSRSMNAAEAGGSRLRLAKQAISQVLAAAPENRVGLVVFGGSAFLQLPLTSNYAAFERFLAAASSDDLADPATDLAGALTAAATAFEHDGERGYQSVLLVSDGESGPGDLGPALERLRRGRVSVFAVGIGSPQGAPVPADSTEAPERWHRDRIGRVVVSRLEEGDLRRSARATNGGYTRWSPDAGRILGTELGRLERRTIAAADSTERIDRFQWPLGLAMAALALEWFTGQRRRRRR